LHTCLAPIPWPHKISEPRKLQVLGQVTDFPTQCTVLVSARTNNIAKIITMEYVFDLSDPYEYCIEKALDLLNRELLPNFESMALRAGLTRSTLSRRFRGVTTSRAEVNSEYRQCLIIAQEEALIKQINKLLIRNMPPTP
jgi:AraC-like DNA-binding protein